MPLDPRLPIIKEHRVPWHYCEAFGEPWCGQRVCPVRERELAGD